ncbi:MAG: hypothetical protein ABFD50_16095 [Smithella sp.]
MYSTAYQTVTAGRVREDEAISFFGDNKIATPARITSFNTIGGKTQPTVEKDVLQHTGVGKPGTVSDNLSAFNPPGNNLS